MKTRLHLASWVAAGCLAASAAVADTPKLEGAHGHASRVSGKITMFRTQEKGLEVMANGEKVDAEILVQLDTQPKLVLTIPLHEQDPARREMVETLRQAYINDKAVTIEHKIAPGKQIAQINWVQYGELQPKE